MSNDDYNGSGDDIYESSGEEEKQAILSEEESTIEEKITQILIMKGLHHT